MTEPKQIPAHPRVARGACAGRLVSLKGSAGASEAPRVTETGDRMAIQVGQHIKTYTRGTRKFRETFSANGHKPIVTTVDEPFYGGDEPDYIIECLGGRNHDKPVTYRAYGTPVDDSEVDLPSLASRYCGTAVGDGVIVLRLGARESASNHSANAVDREPVFLWRGNDGSERVVTWKAVKRFLEGKQDTPSDMSEPLRSFYLNHAEIEYGEAEYGQDIEKAKVKRFWELDDPERVKRMARVRNKRRREELKREREKASNAA